MYTMESTIPEGQRVGCSWNTWRRTAAEESEEDLERVTRYLYKDNRAVPLFSNMAQFFRIIFYPDRAFFSATLLSENAGTLSVEYWG